MHESNTQSQSSKMQKEVVSQQTAEDLKVGHGQSARDRSQLMTERKNMQKIQVTRRHESIQPHGWSEL